VIKAWGKGQKIQVRYGPSSHIWIDFVMNSQSPNFDAENIEWRIKPQTKTLKYRIALMRDQDGPCQTSDYHIAVFNNSEDFIVEFLKSRDFVKWVSDYIETEVTE
jgi:hypothetical protein